MDKHVDAPALARRPGDVPDGAGDGLVGGADTDGDAVPDTLLTVDGVDLLVSTDLDADGFVDRVLRIGPDGAVHPDPLPGPETPVTGTARATWSGLLGRLLGPES